MSTKNLTPSYVFEASWEVCNKVGGIYTVLSTRAKTLKSELGDKVFFIGPDFWTGISNPLFKENKTLLSGWKKCAEENDGLRIRVGRWQVPGEPVAILVDFKPFFEKRNEIFGWAWENFQVDSLYSYGDYDDSLIFSWAAGKVVESYYRYFKLTPSDNVVFQAHEWQTCLSALYINKAVPEVATIFTTHATTIGRSIACNGKPLYDYMEGYNGDQMARELNVESKHSVEKQAAHHVDCFTTVSEITGVECGQLLEKKPDVILMNGFEDDFVPKGADFTRKRKEARAILLNVANTLLGTSLGDDTFIVSTSGRYEYKNKGIDLFVDSLNKLRNDQTLQRDVLAFIMVPAWMKSARADLAQALKSGEKTGAPIGDPRITHELNEQCNDNVLNQMGWLGMNNSADDKVKVIFVPCYLDGSDGIFNKQYYDLLIGNDMTVFPSYYEPWGYTPTESVAFRVPCVTTDLAGFGRWVNLMKGRSSMIEDGVKTVHRSDYNFNEVSEEIKETIKSFSGLDKKKVSRARENAAKIAEKALWRHFIKYYYDAYDIALRKRDDRMQLNKKNKSSINNL